MLAIAIVGGVLLGSLTARIALGPHFVHYLSRYLNQQKLNYVGPSGLQTSFCHCRMNDGICPCTSQSQNPSYDHEIWSQLEAIAPTKFAAKQVSQTIMEATGFNTIEPQRSEGGGRLAYGGKSTFLDGTLEELFLVYERPKMRVRALFSRRQDPTKALLIVTPGSWSTSEHIMGLKDDDYHLGMGRHFFEKGIDVVAFDHGSNGHIEALANVITIVEGTQIFGLWARSVCDLMSRLDIRRKYERVVLYGLSRGGRSAEYVSALCTGFDLVISGDHFISDQYHSYHWNSMWSAKYLKYSSWFLHRVPLAGRLTKPDLMHAAKSPMAYTIYEKRQPKIRETIGSEFHFYDELEGNRRWRFVFKKVKKHVPELEQIERMIAGSWTGIRGSGLLSRRPPK